MHKNLQGKVNLSLAAAAKSLQSCLTLCDPIDGLLPGSSVHGIFQARVGCHRLLLVSFKESVYLGSNMKWYM